MSDLKPWEIGYVEPPSNPNITQEVAAYARSHKGKKKKEEPTPDQVVYVDQDGEVDQAIESIEAAPEWKLTPQQRVKLNAFVVEYFKDFSVRNAYRRLNGSMHTMSYAYKLYHHPYVQWRIQQHLEELDEEDIVTVKEVIMGLKREAHHFGEDGAASARVSALKILATMKGKLVKRSETTTKHTGGVMVIPAPQSVEDWEAMTSASQEQLKRDVRN